MKKRAFKDTRHKKDNKNNKVKKYTRENIDKEMVNLRELIGVVSIFDTIRR